MSEKIDTVIIGGGHAGLTMSYFLGQHGLEHAVLERGRVAERSISERWDSFYFQFPNWTIELPGYKYQSEDPDGFVPGREIVRFIQEYADFIKAPVRCGVDVTALESSSNSKRYLLRTSAGSIEARNMVHCHRTARKGCHPTVQFRCAKRHPPAAFERIPQCRRIAARGRSGRGKRRVRLSNRRRLASTRSTSLRLHGSPSAPRAMLPRSRLRLVGGRVGTVRAPARGVAGDLSSPGPLLTGVNGGYEADWRELASKGIVLLGRLKAVKGTKLALAPDLEDNLAKGDEWLANFKKSVDDYIAKNKLDFPTEISPRLEGSASAAILELDLRARELLRSSGQRDSATTTIG